MTVALFSRLSVPAPGGPRIAVVIPCYRVRGRILSVLARIGPEVEHIIVVDDACPERSGRHVQSRCQDDRVVVLFHDQNKGVGGAVKTGYRQALSLGADVVVKIDGDGQMDPALLSRFVGPIVQGVADYAKGNRFRSIEDVRAMPAARLVGNACLSFMSKLSTGYWHLFDPTNGYTAIHARVLATLPLGKIEDRYFFETDLLFRLGTMGAAVVDVPMTAVYDDHPSGLKIRRVALPFLAGNLRNTAKRIGYNYFLRGFSLASLHLVFGLALLAFGCGFGAVEWLHSIRTQVAATSGTVILAALPIMVGIQFLLSFVGHDVGSVPGRPVHPLLPPGLGEQRRSDRFGRNWRGSERAEHLDDDEHGQQCFSYSH